MAEDMEALPIDVRYCLFCDEDTEHTLTTEEGITIATCPECFNEEVVSTEDDE